MQVLKNVIMVVIALATIIFLLIKITVALLSPVDLYDVGMYLGLFVIILYVIFEKLNI